MEFWFFITIANLLIPTIMIIMGIIFKKHAPKEINGLFGYRTSMSMKNKDTWQFAHHYCGKIWIKIGGILFIISLIVMFFVFGKSKNVIDNFSIMLSFLQIAFLIGSIFPTERALKRTFDQYGNRKN